MNRKNDLYPIECNVKEIVNKLQGQSKNPIALQVIALCRIRRTSILNNGILDYLEKIKKSHSLGSFYKKLLSALTEKFDYKPFDRVFEYLNSKNYSREKLFSMVLSYDEEDIIRKLPFENEILWIICFYLYDPITTSNFFLQLSSPPLSKDEEEFLDNFRNLPFELKRRACWYTKKLLEKDFDTADIKKKYYSNS